MEKEKLNERLSNTNDVYFHKQEITEIKIRVIKWKKEENPNASP